MWRICNNGLSPANTFLGPAPAPLVRSRSCPDLGRVPCASRSREAVLRQLTTVRVKGISSRMGDEEVLELLCEHGFTPSDVDFMLVVRHGDSSKSTSFGYFFANAASSQLAAGLIDVFQREGFECTFASVQGKDVNIAKFIRGVRAAQAWVAKAGVWRCISRKGRRAAAVQTVKTVVDTVSA